ncbi:T-complex protein 1 subunit eta [Tanacetum coccineum]
MIHVDGNDGAPDHWRLVRAHGTSVGLPTEDDMGNSEVRHKASLCYGRSLASRGLQAGAKNIRDQHAAEWDVMFWMFQSVGFVEKHLKRNLQVSRSKYFADRDIFCVGRVAEDDLNTATCGTVQTSVNYVIYEVLGSCEIFEEKQVGNERFNIFSGCHSTTTIVLRGGAHQFIDEADGVYIE